MGKEYTEIDDQIQRWMERQQMFFVSTAPLQSDGLVNCSPKGLASLAVLDSHTLAYADIGGSGIETVAHLKENGRITFMMCAFEGPPKILSLLTLIALSIPVVTAFPCMTSSSSGTRSITISRINQTIFSGITGARKMLPVLMD